jgi:hypothetical protein
MIPAILIYMAVLGTLVVRLSSRRPKEISADDWQAVRAFEAAAIPNGSFHHRDHVRMAWLYLRLYPLNEALSRFTAALRHFAAMNGHSGLYNETVTWAYLLLLNERLERFGRTLAWQEFVELNPDILIWKGSVLERYYRPETIRSDFAKRVFVMPDLD